MKRYVSAALIVFALFTAREAWANNRPTVSDRVNEENIFNTMSDYFSTFGKSDVNKAAIKQQRHEQRRRNRLRSLQHKKEAAQRRRLENEQ